MKLEVECFCNALQLNNGQKNQDYLERKRGRFILYTNLTHHYFSESVLLHHAIYHTSGKKASIALVFFRAQLLAFFYKNSILLWGRRFFLSKYAIMLCREEEKWRRKQKWCKQGRNMGRESGKGKVVGMYHSRPEQQSSPSSFPF